MPVDIRELEPAEIPTIYPLVRQSNPWMDEAEFHRLLADMLPMGYRAIGAYEGGALIGCSGFWISTRFWCRKQIDIDNFIIDPAAQGKGVGRKLVAWIEAKALEEACDLIVLDSYVNTPGAHSFYYKQGFSITGYHFTKMPGSDEVGALPFNKR